MPLESITHISDLNQSNPPGTDSKNQGDDHIRGMKLALRTDLPNINGVVNCTPAQLNLLNSLTALSVLANATNGAAAPAALAAATDGHVLRRSGAALAFGQLDLSNASQFSRTLQSVAKAADTARSSTIVLADDPDLAGLTLEAAKVYRLEMLLVFTQATANLGAQIQLVASQAPVDSGWIANTADVVGNYNTNDVITLATNLRQLTLFSAGGKAFHSAVAYIVSHATNAGTLKLQWCQSGAGSPNATTLLKGSHMSLRRMN